MSCFPFDTLLAWIEAGRPDEGEVASHRPDQCPHCARRLSLLDELAGSLGQPAPEPVPATLRLSVLSAIAAADASAAASSAAREPSLLDKAQQSLGRSLGQAADRLQEFVAELLNPSAAPGLAAGLRGEQGNEVQCYRAGPYTLDLGLVDRRAILGQLTDDEDQEASELSGAECVLCGADGTLEATISEDGGFCFDDAGPGRYALMIETSGVRLVFPDIDLTEA
ncbi:MAG: hypothetical protein DRQ55_09350 [Planctomycetota bacterium]|nr:MAG: hypothetical protein DRQ55_09350 [Planctomycetota bacterium]